MDVLILTSNFFPVLFPFVLFLLFVREPIVSLHFGKIPFSISYPGNHLGAVHGWFIFLKPLSPGEHTVLYVNDVRSTTRGAGNTNNADITYSFNVE